VCCFVPVTSLVFLTFGIVLAIFGGLFAKVGQRGERGYWSQRDPSGNAASEATPLRVVAKHTWRYADSDVRAPLRIMAIGLLMLWLALICLIVAGVFYLVA